MAIGFRNLRRGPSKILVEITYSVDSGESYTEKVSRGKTILNPTSFTPTKTDYSFVGWRKDTVASNDILINENADKPLTLYAVFQKDINLYTYNASTTRTTTTRQEYYNNTNIVDPQFTLSENAVSDWTKAGWANSKNFTTSVADGETITLNADATYYSLYTQNITLTTYNKSTTATTSTKSRLRRYDNDSDANYQNPSWTLSESALSGWTKAGWTNTKNYTATVADGGSVSLESNATYYSLYTQAITLTTYNKSNTAGTSTKDRVRRYDNASTENYQDPSWTLSEATAPSGWSKAGWTTDASKYTYDVADGQSITLTANTTYFSLYTQNITLTTYNGSNTKSTDTKPRVVNYHSSTTYSNPSWTLTENTVTNWTAAGWTKLSDFTATVANKGSVTLTANVTYYSLYTQAVILTTYNASNTASTDTKNRTYRYDGSGAVSNPSWKLTENDLSSWPTKVGWTTSASKYTYDVANGGTVTLTANATYFSLYAQSIVVTKYNGSTTATTDSQDRVANIHSTTTYQNPKFTLTQNAVSGQTPIGWTNSTSGTTVKYTNGQQVTLSSALTVYGLYTNSTSRKLTLYNGSTSASTTTYYQIIRYTTTTTTWNPTVTLTMNNDSNSWTKVGWTTRTSGYTATYADKYQLTLTAATTTLYSVYQNPTGFTVTFYDSGSSAQTATGYQVCNYHSSRTVYGKAVTAPSERNVSGWTHEGWASSSSSYYAAVYEGGTFYPTAAATYYGLYSSGFTVYFYNGSTSYTTASGGAVRNYYNNARYQTSYLSISIPTQKSVSSWTAAGWTDSTSGYTSKYSSGSTVQPTSSTSYYSLYTQSITVTWYYMNSSGSYTNTSDSGTRTANYHSSISYDNPSFSKTISGHPNTWAARGWSTSTAGNGSISYNSGASFTRESSVTLYAAYSRTVAIVYGKNGGSGTMSNSTDTGYKGYAGNVNASITAASCSYTRTGYSFVQWRQGSESGTARAVGWVYKGVDDIVLYAEWKINTITVVSNGTFQSSSGATSSGLSSLTLGSTATYGTKCTGTYHTEEKEETISSSGTITLPSSAVGMSCAISFAYQPSWRWCTSASITIKAGSTTLKTITFTAQEGQSSTVSTGSTSFTVTSSNKTITFATNYKGNSESWGPSLGLGAITVKCT